MAVGAKRVHILMQFLIEAVTLSLVGGIVGVIVGIVGARLTTAIAGWPTIISFDAIVSACIFSLPSDCFSASIRPTRLPASSYRRIAL